MKNKCEFCQEVSNELLPTIVDDGEVRKLCPNCEAGLWKLCYTIERRK